MYKISRSSSYPVSIATVGASSATSVSSKGVSMHAIPVASRGLWVQTCADSSPPYRLNMIVRRRRSAPRPSSGAPTVDFSGVSHFPVLVGNATETVLVDVIVPDKIAVEAIKIPGQMDLSTRGSLDKFPKSSACMREIMFDDSHAPKTLDPSWRRKHRRSWNYRDLGA